MKPSFTRNTLHFRVQNEKFSWIKVSQSMIIQIGFQAECFKGGQQYFSRTTEYISHCLGPHKWLLYSFTFIYILLNFYICVFAYLCICVFALLCTCLVCSLACSGMVGPEKWLQLGEKCNKFDKFPAAVISISFLLYSMMIMTIILVLIRPLTNVTSGVKKQVYKAWLMR